MSEDVWVVVLRCLLVVVCVGAVVLARRQALRAERHRDEAVAAQRVAERARQDAAASQRRAEAARDRTAALAAEIRAMVHPPP